MISRLAGQLLAKTPPSLLVDVQGLGYEVEVPMSTFYSLPEVGQPVVLLTHLVVREDAHLLYGFATPAERQAFRELIRISGVGPRIGLAVLSGLSVDQLVQAVTLQEVALLTRVPGIGKKTAERLVLELKGRLGQALPGVGQTSGPQSDQQTEVLQALLALGYSEKEALAAAKASAAAPSVSDAIRGALKSLAR
ncbi:MAG: Holliday junction branch migration protein RuvA [Pseudomonadota bacterium]|jgi:Holliday junction DNA helicase RuvA